MNQGNPRSLRRPNPKHRLFRYVLPAAVLAAILMVPDVVSSPPAAVKSSGAQAIALRGNLHDPNGEANLLSAHVAFTGADRDKTARAMLQADEQTMGEPANYDGAPGIAIASHVRRVRG